MAPVQGGPEGSLAIWKVQAAAREPVKLVSESFEQRGRWEEPDPRRGELDREREPVESPAEFGNRSRVGLVEFEGRSRGPGVLDEQGDRRLRRHSHDVAGAIDHRRSGAGERGERVLALAPQVDQVTTGHDEVQPWAFVEDQGQLGSGLQNLLEVVQDQQHAIVTDRSGQGVQRGLRSIDRHADRGSDGRRDQDRVDNIAQADEADLLELVVKGPRHIRGNPRLAYAADPRDRQQAHP